MKNPKNSLDSQLLKWSGAALAAFFVAVFAIAAQPGQAASANPQPSSECQAQAAGVHGGRVVTDSCRS
jgi:hypothetical protein